MISQLSLRSRCLATNAKRRQMSLLDFHTKKHNKDKIAMVTCYDYTSARIASDTGADCLLVGDSVAMTVHGFPDTLPATVAMMCAHTEAVHRGAGGMFLVADLPFLSYRQSLSKSVGAVYELMRAGAQAIKLEGAGSNLSLIKHLVESGVPVMGHLGLTPQSVRGLGGYRIQGRTEASVKRLLDDSLSLQECGCFGLVLECIPAPVAKEITDALTIPTIGIGAGPHTDGQVLVWQDMFGLNDDLKPKFVRHFLNGSQLFKQGINEYAKAVKDGSFPDRQHCYE
ncbi:unnamed protein product [Oppiella nova]|uniref:3-methyl-2-oxobutanoate hydroxymethyltransferase n=1 Tax=Oppiella nova TaxID=334625 RepID=A0A7R9LV83_9ACAR|nr:unnamed protein product [Oppiella nova]CAG2167296.1 unnamed protein product [Oppiella nova]